MRDSGHWLEFWRLILKENAVRFVSEVCNGGSVVVLDLRSCLSHGVTNCLGGGSLIADEHVSVASNKLRVVKKKGMWWAAAWKVDLG